MLIVGSTLGLLPENNIFSWDDSFLWMNGQTQVNIGVSSFQNTIAKSGNTISWYTRSGNEYNQCNAKDAQYIYIAIG